MLSCVKAQKAMFDTALPPRAVTNTNPKILSGPEIGEAMPKILGAGQAHFAAQPIYLVVHLGVPNAIGAGCMTVDDIAAKVGPVDKDTLLRAMRYLCCVPGLFVETSRSGNCQFSLTNMGALLQTDVPNQPSMACGMLHWVDPPMMNAFAAMTSYAENGGKGSIFQFANEMPYFDYCKRYPHTAKPFHDMMVFFSQPEIPVVTDSYDWTPYQGKTVVDIGGGLGHVMAALKSKFPKIKTVNFDLPEVISSSKMPPDGVEMVAGDMFVPSTIPKADGAIFMKHILHDWPDEKCTEILKSCREALLPGAKIIIADAVLEEVGKSSDLKTQQLSIHLLMKVGVDGKERTANEWSNLASSAGFSVDGIIMTPFPPNCQFVTLSKQ
jgi:hypothetical protein